MKKPRTNPRNQKLKTIGCTVSAAALMLGVSQAATVGLNFQVDWTESGATAYTGKIVTATAFGIPTNLWENLTPLPTGYNGSGVAPGPFTTNEVISTSTSTDGLNPLPQGSLSITWTCTAANSSGFAGYGPGYGGPNPHPGEQQVYYGFLRDEANTYSTPDPGPVPVSVDISGLKSLFTTTPYVIELVSATDTGNAITNGIITTPTTTDEVTYNVSRASIGIMGGLSTATGALTNDSVTITFAPAVSRLTGTAIAATISGIILTDKPVVTMSPQSVIANPGDNVTLNPYAIGVPPLSYQWQKNGTSIAGATNSSYNIPSFSAADFGSYTMVVSNQYGTAISKPSFVNSDAISSANGNNFIIDSNPSNSPTAGQNGGTTWVASSFDGTKTRSGVAQFVATNSDKITLAGGTNYDVPTGTISFWMRSAGTDLNAGSPSASSSALFARNTGSAVGGSPNDFIIAQTDTGNLTVGFPLNNGNVINGINSTGQVSDNKWHFIALTFDSSNIGGSSLYIDGTLDTTDGNADSWAWLPGQEIDLGYATDGSSRPYDGQLDDFRFYSTQLTASQITSIYTSGAVADAPHLLTEFTFDTPPGQGTTLTWPTASAVLQSATNVDGPYTDVPGASSPYFLTTGVGQKFFRFRYTPIAPTTVVSNPTRM